MGGNKPELVPRLQAFLDEEKKKQHDRLAKGDFSAADSDTKQPQAKLLRLSNSLLFLMADGLLLCDVARLAQTSTHSRKVFTLSASGAPSPYMSVRKHLRLTCGTHHQSRFSADELTRILRFTSLRDAELLGLRSVARKPLLALLATSRNTLQSLTLENCFELPFSMLLREALKLPSLTYLNGDPRNFRRAKTDDLSDVRLPQLRALVVPGEFDNARVLRCVPNLERVQLS